MNKQLIEEIKVHPRVAWSSYFLKQLEEFSTTSRNVFTVSTFGPGFRIEVLKDIPGRKLILLRRNLVGLDGANAGETSDPVYWDYESFKRFQ